MVYDRSNEKGLCRQDPSIVCILCLCLTCSQTGPWLSLTALFNNAALHIVSNSIPSIVCLPLYPPLIQPCASNAKLMT